MMKSVPDSGETILIIADIHGNWPALCAVLAAAPQASRILCLGDLVHYGPDCARIVSWAQASLIPGDIVRGNHDEAAATGKPADSQGFGHPVPDEVVTYTRATVSSCGKQFLGSLPVSSDLILSSERWRLYHGIPSDPLHGYLLEEGLSGRWDQEVRLAGDPEALLVGHTHRPFLKRVSGTIVVNPGSVGRPKDGDPRASFAIWQDGRFTLKRAAYKQTDLIGRLREIFSPDLASQLRAELVTGRKGESFTNGPRIKSGVL